MIALDTNALVRFAVGDDAAQFASVQRLFEQERVLILKTVLLETEWVLRSRYAYEQADMIAYFTFLVGLANVSLEDRSAVELAISAMESGMDFADALHAASAGEAPLLTFDKTLVKAAKGRFTIKLIDG